MVTKAQPAARVNDASRNRTDTQISDASEQNAMPSEHGRLIFILGNEKGDIGQWGEGVLIPRMRQGAMADT